MWYRFSVGHFWSTVRFVVGQRIWKSVPLRTGTVLAIGLLFASSLHAEVRAYPVPWVAKESGPNIVFTDLPGSGNIRIFTVSGEEVVNLPIPAGANQLPWGVVNSSGRKVASGVYFFLVEGAGAETKGKLIVIR
jgi:hypothetical protein